MLSRSIKTALSVIVATGSIAVVSFSDAAKERALTQKELRAIYSHKSWFWKDGVAYFNPSGRFVARTGSKMERNSMRGGWGAYKNGKLCFSGNWKSAQWTSFDSTCFQHKVVKGNVYQRRLPDGDWYIFKHAKTRKNDEYRKVVRGNYVKG